MFENIPNNNPAPQAEPEDILGGVDKTTFTPPTRPLVAPAPAMDDKMMSVNPVMSGSHSSRGVIIAVVVVVIIAVAGLSWYAYGQYFNNNNATEPTVVDETTDQNNNQPVDAAKTDNQQVVKSTTADLDSDSDGIADVKEKTLGTDPYSLDSDMDGLHDKAEIDVYKTDPLKPDTDNDGYKDGEEVKAGYDPNGPGRLFELPTS